VALDEENLVTTLTVVNEARELPRHKPPTVIDEVTVHSGV
jgi:hypothetical protein